MKRKIPDTGEAEEAGSRFRKKPELEQEKVEQAAGKKKTEEVQAIQVTEAEEQETRESKEKKEEFPPIRENPEEDVRLGWIILAVLAAVLMGGGYLLIRFFLR